MGKCQELELNIPEEMMSLLTSPCVGSVNVGISSLTHRFFPHTTTLIIDFFWHDNFFFCNLWSVMNPCVQRECCVVLGYDMWWLNFCHGICNLFYPLILFLMEYTLLNFRGGYSYDLLIKLVIRACFNRAFELIFFYYYIVWCTIIYIPLLCKYLG